MAFSMFLRNSTCNSRLLSQQVLKLISQPPLATRTITTATPLRSTLIKDIKSTTPILNAIRTFRTSSVRLSETPHDHARLWVIEKATSALLVGLVPLGLLMPNKLFDIILAILIVAHSHWGLEAIAVDYVRASIFGPFIPKVAIALVYIFSIATLGGLFYLIGHDIGIGNCFRRLWEIKSDSHKTA